jgi:hypothetical protein
MPRFRVTVMRVAPDLVSSLVELDQEVSSQNAVHAAACGLSLAGTGCADVIEVRALAPRRGRPTTTVFTGCSQGVYGFCYVSRSSFSGHPAKCGE